MEKNHELFTKEVYEVFNYKITFIHYTIDGLDLKDEVLFEPQKYFNPDIRIISEDDASFNMPWTYFTKNTEDVINGIEDAKNAIAWVREKMNGNGSLPP